MLYISVFCKHIETYLNIGYNLVLSAIKPDCQAFVVFTHRELRTIFGDQRGRGTKIP